jgi:hypothetical protein
MQKKSGNIKKKKEVGNEFGLVGFWIAVIILAEILIVFIEVIFSIYSLLFLFGLPLAGLILCVIQIIRKRTSLAIAGLILNIILLILFWLWYSIPIY